MCSAFVREHRAGEGRAPDPHIVTDMRVIIVTHTVSERANKAPPTPRSVRLMRWCVFAICCASSAGAAPSFAWENNSSKNSFFDSGDPGNTTNLAQYAARWDRHLRSWRSLEDARLKLAHDGKTFGPSNFKMNAERYAKAYAAHYVSVRH